MGFFASMAFVRYYSLSSAPGVDPRPQITVKRAPGGKWSGLIVDEIAPGNIIEYEPPQGLFVLPQKLPRKLLFFASGSGITPIYSMLKSLKISDQVVEAKVFYSNRTSSNILFADELETLKREFPSIQVIHFLSREDKKGCRGRLTREYIAAELNTLLSNSNGTLAYLCGSQGYVKDVEAWLGELGLSPTQIKKEVFLSSSLSSVERSAQSKSQIRTINIPEVEIAFETDQGVIRANSRGEVSILDVALDRGIQWPSACRSGICGACQMRMKNGSVIQAGESISGSGKTVLSCISYPASGELTLDLKSSSMAALK